MAARSNQAKSKDKAKKATKAAGKGAKPNPTQSAKAKSVKGLSTKTSVRGLTKSAARGEAKRKASGKDSKKPSLSTIKSSAKKSATVGREKAAKATKLSLDKTKPTKASAKSNNQKTLGKIRKEKDLKPLPVAVKASGRKAAVKPQILVSKPRAASVLRKILPPPPPPAPKPEPRRPASAAALRAFEHALKVFNRRQFAEAKELFEHLQQRFPQEAEILNRVQMYLQVCSQKLAQSLAVAARNVTADELYDRGVYALNIGDFTQARNFFENALRLNPNEPHFLYSLAVTHAQTGAHEEALDYLRRSIQIQPRFRSQAFDDADFSGLRENRQFQELLGLTSPFDLLESRR